MTRIADFAQVQFLAAQLQQTQKKVNDDGIQLSSGQKSPTYAGIASDAQTVLNMQTTSAKIDRYVANANTADTRAQLTSNALQTMQDSLKNLLNQLDIVPANISTLAYQAQSYLKTVADALNVQDGSPGKDHLDLAARLLEIGRRAELRSARDPFAAHPG